MPAAFDRVDNFTSELYFWIFFGVLLGFSASKITKRAKNEAKNIENLKNSRRERDFDFLEMTFCKIRPINRKACLANLEFLTQNYASSDFL